MIPYESYDSGCFVRFVLALKLHIDGPHSILNFFRFLTFSEKVANRVFLLDSQLFSVLNFLKKVENRVFSLDSQPFPVLNFLFSGS